MCIAPSRRSWSGWVSRPSTRPRRGNSSREAFEVPINGLSAATQNIILLRHVEHRASMLRVLAILKVRDDDYDARMREFQITDDGIRLLDTFAAESRWHQAEACRTRCAPRTPRNSGAVATSTSILIVDDEFGLAEMLRDMLREYGYDVTLAINGRLALDILKERPIDLVITDMMMPVMDGAELATAMRESETHRDIPIVMMTSLPSAMPQQSELFDAVLRKPFTPELLLRTVRACFAGHPHVDGQPVVDRSPGAGEATTLDRNH